MNLNHLRTFDALARAGSFAGAARRLGLPASTVTGHIAALESSLGVTLVIRTTRAMRLTQVGAQLAADAATVIAAADEAAAQVARARAAPGGSLRLSLPVAFAHDLLAPLLGRFLALNPGIALDLRLSNRRTDLIAEGIDLAVRVGPLTGHSLQARLLTRARIGIFAPATQPAPRSLAELAHVPILAMTPDPMFEGVGPQGPVRQPLSARMAADDPKTLALAVAAGAGVAMLPAFLMGSAVAAGTVREVLTDHSFAPVDVHLVALGSLRDTPAAQRLTDYLAANLPRAI